MDLAKIRGWWAQKQGLSESSKNWKPADVLVRSGWARSVGGVGPYLTFFSRAGISRMVADKAIKDLDIHELPSARGCTYVLPNEDFALGLLVGQDAGSAEFKTALKLGVTAKEIDRLCQAVLDTLDDNPMDPEEIRQATGKASRNLGEEGKKKGVTTTLPIALGRLQASGYIRRVPVTGRIDQQRYKYAIWNSNPLKSFPLSPEEAFKILAKKFFRWIGPATAAEFQWFSGLGVKATGSALQFAGLVPIEDNSDFRILEDELDAFHKFKKPKGHNYKLVSSLDSIHALRRDTKMLLEESYRKKIFADSRKASGFADLESHAIIDKGRIIGLWEFDIESLKIVWCTFVKPDKDLKAEIKRTEDYVVSQLGDARSFSLDSPKSRKPRIEAIRAMSGM